MENDWVRGCGNCASARGANEIQAESPSARAAARRQIGRIYMDGQDGLQDIRSAVLRAPDRITMVQRCDCAERSAKSPTTSKICATFWPRPARTARGTRWPGIAAESGEQRAAAQMTLADVPLRAFLQQALVPYEERRGHPADCRYSRSCCLCSGSGAYGGRSSRLAALRCRDGRGAGGGSTGFNAGDGRGGQQVDAGAGPDPGGTQDTRGDAVQDHGGLAREALYAAAAEPSRGRSGRHRGGHGRWAHARLGGCGDRD